MAKFVSVFISAAYRRLFTLLVWVVAFVVVASCASWYALHTTKETMKIEADFVVEHFVRLRENLASTFEVIHRDLTADPCSPAFRDQLRRIAYLPDGLNEFLYAPGGKVQCSSSSAKIDPPVDLGKPDIAHHGVDGGYLWVDHGLDFLGLEGERGTIFMNSSVAVVVPPQRLSMMAPPWLGLEAVMVGDDGAWWHRTGESGIYARMLSMEQDGLTSGKTHTLTCDYLGVHCVAAEADLLTLLAGAKGTIAMVAFVAALLASGAAAAVNAMIRRFWSFEARFRRHLNADSIICAYQPVMELETGEITGCEVLARWRDVDDRIVFPDRFIDIIERHGMTERFTELVVQRACKELSEHLPRGKKLQINFNIFPCDLDSVRLARIFSGFTAQPERFSIVLEIIESEEVPANAQREIEALRRQGIRTYIDDFGTGYSNMQSLGALSVDGVKLDRAFAMAPDNSMMAQMLRHAVEMIHATGRVMVVEGVETAERLALLRQMEARIDFVQGYFISRPLDIDRFVTFMTPQPVSIDERKKKARLKVVAA